MSYNVMIAQFIAYIHAHYLEVMCVILSLYAAFLDTRQKVLARILTFPKLFLAFFVYYQAGLYAKCLYYFIYAGLNAYGWYAWLYGGKHRTPLPISKTRLRTMVTLVILGLIGSFALGSILKVYAPARLPYLDAVNAVFSLIEKWMLAKKKLERWLLSFLRTLYFACICYYSGLFLFSGSQVVYALLALYGYRAWYRAYLNQAKEQG